ncbi:MAG: TonB-dependent receptor [bacterium]|nr:TonB-dependent receptor [bacterium]
MRVCLTSIFMSLALIGNVLAAESGGYPIRGFVLDATSAEPLPSANVTIAGTDRGASTNLDGYFVIDYLQPGSYFLTVAYMGYHNLKKTVSVTDKVMDPLRIELVPTTLQMEDIEVIYNKEDEEVDDRQSPQVSAIPMDVNTIRRMPSLGGEMDVLRTLQQLPGVKASSDLNSALYVRGGSPDQTLILMDHNVVYNPSHLFGLFSTFNADAVKRIELLKGGFPAEYGGRSGSVLDVITNEGNRKKTEGMFSLGIISSRAALEGPLPKGRGSYALSARRTYMEPIIDQIRKSTGTDLPDYYFWDGNGKVNLDLTPKTTLTLAGYWGSDHLKLDTGPTDSPIRVKLDWGNRTFSSRLRQVLSRNMFFSVSAAVSRYESGWTFENDGVKVEDADDRLVDYSLKSDLELLGGQNHHLKTGIWISRYDFLLKMFNDEKPIVDVDAATYNYSWYAQDRWVIHPMFEVEPGVRAYYHAAGNRYRLDPRLAMVFHYGPDMRFKLAGGRYTQWIALINFGEGMSNFDIWTPIDETIEPTYCDQGVLGFEWEPRQDLEFTTETYYTDMKNVHIFNSLISDKSTDASKAYLTGKGYAYGWEWMLRRKEGRLTGWVGYSLSWTRRRFPDTYQNNGQWYYPKWDRRHDFIATGMYELNDRWDLSASWRYNTGQGFTQPLGLSTLRIAGVDPQYLGDDGRWVINGELNNYRFPSDHRLDVTATWKHHFFTLPAKLNISIFNVYSRRSYWMRVTYTNKNPVEIKDVKLLPILPMISYEVRF